MVCSFWIVLRRQNEDLICNHNRQTILPSFKSSTHVFHLYRLVDTFGVQVVTRKFFVDMESSQISVVTVVTKNSPLPTLIPLLPIDGDVITITCLEDTEEQITGFIAVVDLPTFSFSLVLW